MAATMGVSKKAIRGFTYLWVLMLVAFMGLGLSAAAVIDSTVTRRSQEQELLAKGHQFRDAIARYYEIQAAGGKHEYPNSLDDLLRDNRFPAVKRHLRQIYVDPITGKAEWGLVRYGGRITGVYSLSESKPIKQDLFAPEDSSFRGKEKYSDWVFTHPPSLLLGVPPAPAIGAASQPASP